MIPDPVRVHERVRSLLGPGGADVVEGRAVARPASDEEVAGLLRTAREEEWRVLPAGADGGRHSPLAGRADLILSTARLRGGVEHEPEDLTVRVRAGCSLEELQKGVGAAGQWLALDPPGGPEASVGSLVAKGTAGPLRAGYGRPRDQLLGLTLVDGRGEVLELGGRVVKNVAGFDLVRLAAGSRGALGLVTRAAFRLFPRPREDRTLLWERDAPGEAWALGRELAAAPVPLAAAELLTGSWPAPLDGECARVLIRLTGSAPAVSAVRAELERIGGPPHRDLAGEASRAGEAALSRAVGRGAWAFRLHALPARGRQPLDAVGRLGVDRSALHLLHGTFRCASDREWDGDRWAAFARTAREAGADLLLLRAPPEGAPGPRGGPAFPGFGDRVAALEKALLAAFDPGGILPGAWGEGEA